MGLNFKRTALDADRNFRTDVELNNLKPFIMRKLARRCSLMFFGKEIGCGVMGRFDFTGITLISESDCILAASLIHETQVDSVRVHLC